MDETIRFRRLRSVLRATSHAILEATDGLTVFVRYSPDDLESPSEYTCGQPNIDRELLQVHDHTLFNVADS